MQTTGGRWEVATGEQSCTSATQAAPDEETDTVLQARSAIKTSFDRWKEKKQNFFLFLLPRAQSLAPVDSVWCGL